MQRGRSGVLSRRVAAATATLVAVVVTTVTSGLATGSAGARAMRSATPRVLANGEPLGHGALLRRPGSIVYSGDGAALLAGAAGTSAHLRWTRWTGHGGRATGADWRDDCRPDCADGHYHRFAATVRVYRPRRVHGRRVFTRMTIRYRGPVPPAPAVHRSVTFRLRPARGGADFLYWAS